jgi:hypothetical protein
MRIRLVGGTGLVRSAIQARLSAEGPECVLVSRHPPAPNTHHITLDMVGPPTLRNGRTLLPALMSLSMRRVPCRNGTCRRFMLLAAWRGGQCNSAKSLEVSAGSCWARPGPSRIPR